MIPQKPTKDTNWLYKDCGDERLFSQEIYLPDDAEPWSECTEEEKEQYEKSLNEK